ncbi:PTS sugar transporter subunit IIA [Enterococcus devriesei]|uniref:PTS system, mannose/fructose/sorbose family, IIA component n=1 Tax=Enterococcus devriesei TaxID=319970 RepID=A0A1L8SUN5_9ENTE|nr:PTS fructose transporter subunit IIA [Enterococcus devriesei]MBU5364879.1 PTS fructose transporter subunit IIA [Enterococcus devriesei]MDT2821304.1 PTS fructose transporter subunit IIA [Enterococcus devriesei]MDU6524712.1 PTS fructose transporter subunit IIA [Enterococcus sp.]OJG35809.1 PTS system, mannose/fructose/sorbose family, IIA component [Enterococcus devriesei]
MSKALVLVSHGLFCEELKKSTEMIMGPQENIHTVGLLPSESAEDFRAKFEATIEQLEDFVVLADLMGGTPCNVVSRLILEGREIELYAGMNMPMVIDFINSQLIGTELSLVESAQSNICHVNERINNVDDEDE